MYNTKTGSKQGEPYFYYEEISSSINAHSWSA